MSLPSPPATITAPGGIETTTAVSSLGVVVDVNDPFLFNSRDINLIPPLGPPRVSLIQWSYYSTYPSYTLHTPLQFINLFPHFIDDTVTTSRKSGPIWRPTLLPPPPPTIPRRHLPCLPKFHNNIVLIDYSNFRFKI